MESMGWLQFVQIVEIPIIGGALGIMWKVITDVGSFKVHVAEKYVAKEELDKAEGKIYATLDRIEKKLDQAIQRKKDYE